MPYRIFKRAAWKPNPSWPEGFEPYAKPMDKCRTLRVVDTEDEARAICTSYNDDRPKRGKGRYTAPYYEYTRR